MLFSVQGVIFFRTQLAFKKVQFLTINVVWWVCKHNLNRQKKTAMHFLFFIYTILTWKFKYITYINKLYYIYKQVFLGHLGCTVFIQDSFLFIHAHIYTCMHMHTPIHLHARTHYSDAHTTCEKVSLSLTRKSSQSTLVRFTTPSPCFCSFRLLFYAIQNSTLPISPFKFSIPALLEIICHLLTECKKLQ